jgi:hypothetical protein
MAARSKVWEYGRSFPGIAGSNPRGESSGMSLESVVCCQVEFSASE